MGHGGPQRTDPNTDPKIGSVLLCRGSLPQHRIQHFRYIFAFLSFGFRSGFWDPENNLIRPLWDVGGFDASPRGSQPHGASLHCTCQIFGSDLGTHIGLEVVVDWVSQGPDRSQTVLHASRDFAGKHRQNLGLSTGARGGGRGEGGRPFDLVYGPCRKAEKGCGLNRLAGVLGAAEAKSAQPRRQFNNTRPRPSQRSPFCTDPRPLSWDVFRVSLGGATTKILR